MELSSDEKCAIKRDCVVGIVRETVKTLSFEDKKNPAFASKPAPPARPQPPRQQGESPRETNTSLLHSTGAAKWDTSSKAAKIFPTHGHREKPTCLWVQTGYQNTMPQQHSKWGSKSLIGAANECVATVNGWACLALLDTGSEISSISESFYNNI